MEDKSINKESYEKVTNVIPLVNAHLLLTFDNLELKIYDCRPWLDDLSMPMSQPMFNDAHADSGGVSWSCGPYISSEILYKDSIALVDFLDELLGGQASEFKQKDPYFIHDSDEIPDDLFHAQMKHVGTSHYQAGQRDKEAEIAATMIMLMKYADLDSYSIVTQLQIVLGLPMGQAMEYYLNLQ